MNIQFHTDLYHVPSFVFGGYHACSWKLWFTEAAYVEDRQQVIDLHQLPVKPTKRQIRKLRRQFRKAIKGIH